MENQPPTPGVPGSANSDSTDQSGKFAHGRGISDLAKNKGKDKDDAAYLDDRAKTPEDEKITEGEKQADTKPEDFEPFNLDAVDDADTM